MIDVSLDRSVLVSYFNCRVALAVLALPMSYMLADNRPAHFMPQSLQALRYVPQLPPHSRLVSLPRRPFCLGAAIRVEHEPLRKTDGQPRTYAGPKSDLYAF